MSLGARPADVDTGGVLLDADFDGIIQRRCCRFSHLYRDQFRRGCNRLRWTFPGILLDPAAQLVGIDAMCKRDRRGGNARLAERYELAFEFGGMSAAPDSGLRCVHDGVH